MEELTIKAAAEYYGKSDSWIRKKILSGELEAEKRPFQYGERWITTEKALDQLAEDLQEQAKMQKDSVNVREVKRPVDKEQLINDLIEATEGRNKALIDKAANNIVDKIQGQNNRLQQQNKKLENKLDKQQELIEKLSDQVDKLQQNQNKSLIDKIKQFFT